MLKIFEGWKFHKWSILKILYTRTIFEELDFMIITILLSHVIFALWYIAYEANLGVGQQGLL